MVCKINFLPVGNADSIIVRSDNDLTVLIDLGKPRLLDNWLQSEKITHIQRIYVSHAHGDHCPSLVHLVSFLKIWLERGNINEICLPYNMYQAAKKNLLDKRAKNPGDIKLERIETALNELNDWDRQNIVNFLPVARGSEKNYGKHLKISALHPRQLYVEDHLARTTSKLNEISLVLKITYGDFTALFLADIEGAGLQECINICNSKELKAHLVKIPHHGAYPNNGNDFKKLLKIIDAEIAILSVGSTNSYGHVMPELFSLLLDIQNDSSKNLKSFTCTEVTRTCVCSKSKIASMNRSGLTKKQLCAGEITISADVSGTWNITTETNHDDIISELQYPACQGKAELS